MDISDGLLQDAGHMARASGVALHLQRSLLPHCAALAAWPECQRLDWMLRGGDDYVLLFSIAAADLEQLGDWPVTVICRVEAGEGVWLDGQPAVADGGNHHLKELSDARTTHPDTAFRVAQPRALPCFRFRQRCHAQRAGHLGH